MIKSFDLEKRVLSGIVQHQEKWGEVASLLKDEDFYSVDSKVHISIFQLVRSALNNAEALDQTILAERILKLGVSFPDDVSIKEYIYGLFFHEVKEDAFVTAIKDLKKLTLRRSVLDQTQEIAKYVKTVNPSTTYDEMIAKVDSLHNDNISNFETEANNVPDLSDLAEGLIEGLRNNPPEEVGYMSPYQTINDIYGSIFRGGNITCWAARAKCGKTTVLLDSVLKTSYNYGVPVLHFDNGEMSENELIFRMVSNASGIPSYLLESGKWRCSSSYGPWTPQEVVERVRATWSKFKKTKILYQNVAGLSSEDMQSLLKRIYYSKVGRGKKMLFSFDYLKTDFNNLGKGSEWAFVGKTLHDFKQTITKDLKFDGEPTVSMSTSVQLNRLGITTNRNADNVEETETEQAIGLSDNIIQFVSHLFLLRHKTVDERVNHGEQFGTHIAKCLAARHLGPDMFAHINPIQTEAGPRNNFINFDFRNFRVTDKGDLRSIVEYQKGGDVGTEEGENDLPEGL